MKQRPPISKNISNLGKSIAESLEKHKPLQPIYGRYSSKEIQKLFPPPETHNYRFDCSPEMRTIFSEEEKFLGWRDMWITLAEGQKKLGQPISEEQISALKRERNNLDINQGKLYEKAKKHDVMAFIQEYSDKVGPEAAKIIHNGATSMFVCDNQEIGAMKKGLELILKKVDTMNSFKIDKTIVEPVQKEVEYRLSTLKARGAKGTTGTQASFLRMFEGNHEKVKSLDEYVAKEMGFEESYTITGQTYPRIVDYQILSTLELVAHSVAMSFENPTLKAHYQKLANEVSNKAKQAAVMASNQWLERSLDDSSQRRIILSEAFYLTDHILDHADGAHLIYLDAPTTKFLENEKEALEILANKTANVIGKISNQSEKHKETVCIGFTHGQFAQPMTYGKREAMWNYNFTLALNDLKHHLENTSEMNPFLHNILLNSKLNQLAIAAGKVATDIRILQHDGELNEPFGVSQKGSSAMAYKRNPMTAERTNGLALTKIMSTQPGTFTPYDMVNTDAVVEPIMKIFSEDTEKQKGYVVHEDVARKNLENNMPFVYTEKLLIDETKKGGNREDIHERIRLASLKAITQINEGTKNLMYHHLANQGFDIDLMKISKQVKPEDFIGRSVQQVDEFYQKEVKPILQKYSASTNIQDSVNI